MPATWLKGMAWALVIAAGTIGLGWFARQKSVPVDLAVVTMGPLEVTVDDEAKTRVRHVYTVSAPTAGKVLRISRPFAGQGISLHVGDQVVANETVVAIMQPVVPSFLDFRSREELQAMLSAADATMSLAQSEAQRIEAALDFARGELQRAETLARTDAVSARAVEKARLDVRTNEAALASAKAQFEVRRSERAAIAARLIDPATNAASPPANCCIQLRAPVTGRVLKIVQESEAVVAAGAPLVEIGDPLDLEVVADLLSTDAIRIQQGAAVRIDGWGGPPLRGRVTRIDPTGFTKVSALGIEEQRVRTTIDFVDPPKMWSGLGHDYRVIVHVRVWNAESVLTLPVGALFRQGDEWAVFSVRDGRARTTIVKVGHRTDRFAEVRSGLSSGDRVVLHPSDRVKEGIAVSARVDR